MKTLVVIGSLLFVVTAAAAAGATERAAAPRLGVADERPLTIRGAGFEATERVLVRVAAGRVWTRRVVARAAGTFTARFAETLADCQRFTVRAVGDLGSQARLFSGVRISCVPTDAANANSAGRLSR
jgi:hypothetical protein